jgi:catalase
MLRDGMHQTAVHRGVAPYRPNSLDGGCPFLAGADTGAYIEVPVDVPAGRKVRDAAASFDDHFSQPRLFWLSMTPTEREHIIAAYTFELNKCYETAVKERALKVLANVDGELCEQVAAGLGLPAPEPAVRLTDPAPSPALSQIGRRWPLDGRVVGIVTGGDDLDGVRSVRDAVLAAGMVPLVVAPAGGVLGSAGRIVQVQRTFATARSTEFDAVLLAGAPVPAPDAHGARDAKADDDAAAVTDLDPRVMLLLTEAYRHGKALGAWGPGLDALEASGISAAAPGIVTGDRAGDVLEGVADLLAEHRAWDRFPPAV